jgi:hypothetical protein
MRRLALALLVLHFTPAGILEGQASQAPAGASEARSTTDLMSGFRVVRGTHLVGAVFPALDQNAEQLGWTAVLTVSTDAATAMAAYQTQAVRKGFRQSASQRAGCQSAEKGTVLCSGTYFAPDASLIVVVKVCRFCDVPVAEAQLTYQVGAIPLGDLEEISSLVAQPVNGHFPTSVPTARLTAAEMRHMLRRPEQGDSGFHSEPGSTLLAPPSEFDSCQPDLVAVVKVTGDPDRVQQRYGGPATVRAQIGTTSVSQTTGEFTSTILVRDSATGSTFLWWKHCAD